VLIWTSRYSLSLFGNLNHDDACHVVRHASRKAVLVEVAGSDLQDVTGWYATQRVERVLRSSSVPSVHRRQGGSPKTGPSRSWSPMRDGFTATDGSAGMRPGASLQYSVHHLARNCSGSRFARSSRSPKSSGASRFSSTGRSNAPDFGGVHSSSRATDRSYVETAPSTTSSSASSAGIKETARLTH